MPTQTGSIDLEATNAVKLAAEASVDNKLTNYATHAELTVSANNIKSEVAETYATKDEAALELDGSGTAVVLDEAADAPLKSLTIHGKSVQDGTPTPSAPVAIKSVQSTNLLGNLVPGDYSALGLTVTVGENNIVTMTGTPTSTGSITIPLEEQIPFPSGTVYFHFRNRSVNTGVSFTLQPSTAGYNGPSATFSAYFRITQVTGTSLPTLGSIRLYVNSQQTFTNMVFQPTLEYAEGHTPFTTYGGISLASRGENLLELNKIQNPYSYGGTAYYVDFTVNGSQLCPVVLEEGVTYTLSMNVESSVYPTRFSVGCGNGTYAKDVADSQTITQAGRWSKTFTPTAAQLASGNILAFRVPRYSVSTTFTATVSNIQLELGSTATAYESYSSTATPIPVTLRSLPDGTHDEWISGDTEDTLVQRVQRLYFDGSDMTGWAVQGSYASTGGGYYVYTNPDNDSTVTIATSNARTNRLVWASGGLSVSADNTGKVGYANNPHFFRIRPEETTAAQTVSVLQTWLQSNPLEVLLPLANPITTTLAHVDLPIIHDGDSVWVDAQVTPTIDATYWSKNGESVSALSSTLTQTAAGLELQLSGKVDSSEEWVSWMHAGTDPTTHEPYLAMGQDSDYPSVVYGSSAARFYDGEGDADSNVVASFGAGGAVVGNVESSHTSITPEVTAFHDANGNEAARISMSDQGAVTAWASYSVNPTSSWTDRTETGITPLPDFTLGDLELTVSVDGEVIHSYSISSLTEPQISVTYGDIDIKFQATKSGDTWTAAMSCRNRDLSAQPTVTFGLSWEHIGTAPMWKFGGATAQGAYSFSAGDGNQPTGEGAVTLGLGLMANRQAQVVVGKHNKPYQSARFIVGNGTDDAGRSNALAVTDQGIETVGYIQNGGTVGLGSEAQQAWQTALGLFNLFHFKTVTSSSASVGSGSVVEFTATIPDVSGMTCRGAVQVWTSGTGTTIVGAPWRSSADSKIHSKVRGNVASNVSVSWLLFYTADAFTTTS